MKKIAIIFFILSACVFGYWGASGAHFATQYEVPTKVVTEDDFGDKVEKTVMKKEFRFGLTPDKGYDGALPIGGGFGGIGIVLLIAGIMRDKKTKGGVAPA